MRPATVFISRPGTDLLFAAACLVAACSAGFNGAVLRAERFDTTVAANKTSLDGEWQIALETAPRAHRPIHVPGTIEDQINPDFDGKSIYFRAIEPVRTRDDERILLRFHGVATEAEVYFCGERLGTHLGAWTPFEFDVTTIACSSDDWNVEVRVDEKVGHNTQGFLPVFTPHFGGIWKPVELIVTPSFRFDELSAMVMGNADGTIHFELPVTSPAPITGDVALQIQTRLHGDEEWSGIDTTKLKDVQTEGKSGSSLVITGSHQIKNENLWSPDNPVLYEVRFVATNNKRTTNELVMRTGLRDIVAVDDRILLNGHPLNIRGLLNWGYAPPSNAPSLDEDFMRHEIRCAKTRGFNLMKFCLWIPPQRYLELCDELGMLAWVEYPTWHPDLSAEHLPPLTKEFDEFFLYDRNHPSVVLRSLTCETGHSADLDVIKSLYDLCKQRIPGAIIEDDSSWIQWNRIHDFYDDHPYGNNHTWVSKLGELKKYISQRETKPLVLGEAIAADTWTDPDELLIQFGDKRPFWLPGFLDANKQWHQDMTNLIGPNALANLRADSLNYAMLMRKYQIEAYRREVPYGGYVVSVMRDIPLCGMGLIDYADNEKFTADQWNWHGDNMLLLKTENDRRSFEGGKLVEGEILSSSHGREPGHELNSIEVRLLDESGRAFGKSSTRLDATGGSAANLSHGFSFDVPVTKRPIRLLLHALSVDDDGTRVTNHWPIWIVPAARVSKRVDLKIHDDQQFDFDFVREHSVDASLDLVYLTRFLDAELLDIVASGRGDVILLPSNEPNSFPLKSHWFLRGGPVVADSERFSLPRQMLVELQHFDLAGDIVPEIQNYSQFIDPVLLLWDNHDLKHVNTHGVIYRIPFSSGGSIFVCAARVEGETNSAGRYLLAQLLNAPVNINFRKVDHDVLERLRSELSAQSIRLDKLKWRFRPDLERSGSDNGWHQRDFDDSDWGEIAITRHWESQGFETLDDWAWYRVAVDIPEDWTDRRFINFTGVDDHYRLYINGNLVGESGDIENRITAFEERKSWDITSWTRGGERVQIAIAVYDWQGAGGIFRPAMLSTQPLSDAPRLLK